MSHGREKFVADDEARRSDLVDIAAEVRGETEKALRLYDGAREAQGCEGTSVMIDEALERERARLVWSARDQRVLHPLLGILISLVAFEMGRIAVYDDAMLAARRTMAENKSRAEKALVRLEVEWPCVAWGPDVENLRCVIRERKR